MPAFALLAASLPLRVASLNLCTDEYLLLLADPRQVVSVSYLSRDPQELPLWRDARRYRGNRGSIEDVLTARPDLILTMGGSGRATTLLSARLHIRSLDLPNPTTIGGVAANLRAVAAALGTPSRAAPWIANLAAGAPPCLRIRSTRCGYRAGAKALKLVRWERSGSGWPDIGNERFEVVV